MKRAIHRLPASLRWGLLAQFTARRAVQAAVNALDDLDLNAADSSERDRWSTPGQCIGVGAAIAPA
jgi:hypothetical protein